MNSGRFIEGTRWTFVRLQVCGAGIALEFGNRVGSAQGPTKEKEKEVTDTRFEPVVYGLVLDLLVATSFPVNVPARYLCKVHHENPLSTTKQNPLSRNQNVKRQKRIAFRSQTTIHIH
jgi:hypothetical protein